MEQDLRDEGAARARHVVHVLPSDDMRVVDAVRTLVERLAGDETPGLRLLVLTPSLDEVARLAALVNDGLDASGPLLVPVTDVPRATRRLAAGCAAALLTPELAATLIARSVLKLDAVGTVALLQLDALVTRDEERLQVILAEVPKGASSVATAEHLSAAVEAFIERHARKARRMTYDAPVTSDAITEYVVCDATRRADTLGAILGALDPAHATVVASEDDAEAACAALAQLGYGPEDALVSFSDGECPENEPLVVLFTAPADPGELTGIVEATPGRVVTMVLPEELAAFRRVFGAGARPATLPGAAGEASTAIENLRARITATLSHGGLHHEVLALSPLFAAHDPAEVAAAVLRLLEAAGDRPQAARPTWTPEPRSVEPARAARAARPAPRGDDAASPEAASGTFTSLFITIGEKDGARKGDLVGAISNEAGISSELLGKITMRDTFSVVEVDSSVAARVIETLNGKTIRGRVAAVREDRAPERKDAGDRPRRSFGAGARGGASDRPRRTARDDRGPRSSDDRPRGRGGFGGARGTGRPTRDNDRPRRPSRDDAGGPRTFRDGERGRNPRAMDESREWRERGERLRHTRRPRRGDD